MSFSLKGAETRYGERRYHPGLPALCMTVTLVLYLVVVYHTGHWRVSVHKYRAEHNTY